MFLRLLLGLLLAAAVPQAADQPQSPPSSFAGSWSGAARLTVGVGGTDCRYEPPEGAKAATMHLEPSAQSGVLTLDLPESGAGCPPFKGTYSVRSARADGNRLSVSDDAGHEWSLTLREGRLKGLVSGGGLSGEVDLAPETGAQPAPPAPQIGASPAATPIVSTLRRYRPAL